MDFVILKRAVRGSFTPTCSELYPPTQAVDYTSVHHVSPAPNLLRLCLVHYYHTVSTHQNFGDLTLAMSRYYFHWLSICIVQWLTFKGQSQTMICLCTVVIAKRYSLYHFIRRLLRTPSHGVCWAWPLHSSTHEERNIHRQCRSDESRVCMCVCVRWVINSIRNKDLLYWDALCCNGCLIGSQLLYWQVKWTD